MVDMSDTANDVRKRPGRKAETPTQRLQRLERDLVLARKAVADTEQRRLAVIGSAVLAEAAENADFRDQLHKLLRTRVTTKAKKADIAGMLESSTA